MKDDSEDLVLEGDVVLFLTERGKRYLVQVVEGKRFHSGEGYVDLSSIIGMPYGGSVRTNIGRRWFVLFPKFAQKIMKVPRVTQIVYPKDLGAIIMMADIHTGSRVVDGGTGSGVLTATIARYVSPTGEVYSYDVNERNLEAAKAQLARLGLLRYVSLKQGDLTSRIDEVSVDAVTLDIPTPWLAVGNAYRALRAGGMLLSLSPTIEQVVETVESMKETGFVDIENVEILLRRLRVRRGMTRPEHIMRAHTTYITSGRKALKEVSGGMIGEHGLQP
ncbi:MAG: tRNA (adenine-N1)-methyltransferase [Nitrososphaeria archaeon]